MSYIQGQDRNQPTLLPNTLEDYISADNAARVIDAFVNTLDLASLGLKSEAPETGRPGYDPCDMLKLYIYGYQDGIRSSRK